MVTVLYDTFQNIVFSVGIEAKNDPLNIPIFGFELIFLQEVRSSCLNCYKNYALGTLIKSVSREMAKSVKTAGVVEYRATR